VRGVGAVEPVLRVAMLYPRHRLVRGPSRRPFDAPLVDTPDATSQRSRLAEGSLKGAAEERSIEPAGARGSRRTLEGANGTSASMRATARRLRGLPRVFTVDATLLAVPSC
jgi:hypothetical protein